MIAFWNTFPSAHLLVEAFLKVYGLKAMRDCVDCEEHPSSERSYRIVESDRNSNPRSNACAVVPTARLADNADWAFCFTRARRIFFWLYYFYKRFSQEYDTVKAQFEARMFDYAKEDLSEYIDGNTAEQVKSKKTIFAAFA
jgi:hypothetical protein